MLLRAPRERVWRAIGDSRQFGAWFGVAFDGEFAEGATLMGKCVPTTVDPEVAKQQESYAGKRFEIVIDRIEPMRLFSFRWHPFAIEEGVDYSHEPMTTVTFTLDAVNDGTLLTITETGFEGVPLARRLDAFEANVEGWTAQIALVEKYVMLDA
jgi:uncharacterized protein YndB with AHSA1/START domain